MVRCLAKSREITETLKGVVTIPFFRKQGLFAHETVWIINRSGQINKVSTQLRHLLYMQAPLNRACFMQFIIFFKHVVFAYNTK